MKKAMIAVMAAVFVFLMLQAAMPQDKKEGEAKEQKKEETVSPEQRLSAYKYYPMEKGNWWEYKLRFEAMENMPTPPEGLFDQMPRLEVQEVTKNGCRVVPAEEGSFGIFSAQSVTIENGFLAQEMFPNGGKVKVLKLPPKKGDKWTSTIDNLMGANEKVVVEHAVSSIGKLKTPAGKFSEVVRVVSVYNMPEGFGGDGEDSKVTITMWYAPGIGMVKTAYGSVRGSLIIELNKYGVKSAGDSLISAAAVASEFIVIASLDEVTEEKEDDTKTDNKDDDKEPQCDKPAQVTLKVEQVLKGELKDKEIVISSSEVVTKGKWVLFLGKLEKEGYPVLGPKLPAQEEILKKVDTIINPPKPKTMDEKLVEAEMLIVGKAILKEDRGEFSYWVFEVESRIFLYNKEKEGDKRSHVDVLDREEYGIEENERYIIALKQTEEKGRKLFEVIGEKPEKYTEEKWEEYGKEAGKVKK